MAFSFKARVRAALAAGAPEFAAAVFSARARAFAQRGYRERGCLELNERIRERAGTHVLAGPFAGLELSPRTFQEHLGPYLLGTYESELHPIWPRIFAKPFVQALDIGAKFGFYAVGLARRFPDAGVVAFDPDRWARGAIREMASANRTGNVRAASFCSIRWLREHLRGPAFILSDCEGYEAVLFGDAGQVPAFRSATLLIELHEHASPGVERIIRGSFGRTHSILSIPANSARAVPEAISDWPPERQALAMSEFRGADQSWLFLEPLPR